MALHRLFSSRFVGGKDCICSRLNLSRRRPSARPILEQGVGEAYDGAVNGEDANDIGAPLDLAVKLLDLALEPLDRRRVPWGAHGFQPRSAPCEAVRQDHPLPCLTRVISSERLQ